MVYCFIRTADAQELKPSDSPHKMISKKISQAESSMRHLEMPLAIIRNI
jgi:hypothetical protein